MRGKAQPPDPVDSDERRFARKHLDAYTSADLQTLMKTLMPLLARHMSIVSIAVHPDHQGKGVGTALIGEGADHAVFNGVGCSIQASEAGASMLQNCGFEEISRLDLDLDEWNWIDAVPPEDRKQHVLIKRKWSEGNGTCWNIC